jgi:hypothetical protein
LKKWPKNQSINCIFFFSTAVKKICDIYDWDGKGELDMFFLGDVMYALGMNTTKKVSQGNPPGSKKLPHHVLLPFSQENPPCSKKLLLHVLILKKSTILCYFFAEPIDNIKTIASTSL